MSKSDQNTSRDEVINLDNNAQRALAYLSGIPPAKNEEMIETVSDVSTQEHRQFQQLIDTWLQYQADEIREIGRTLVDVLKQLDLSNKRIRDRLESPQYLKLIRKSFRNWSTAESSVKRLLMRNILVSASTKTSSPDFVISMFIDWLDKYSDEHFRIIETVSHKEPAGVSRYHIWHEMYSHQPGEDSAEADLYRLLILDLTTGHIIRQAREKDFHGNFVKSKPTSSPADIMSPTFDDQKKYVLTELGKQFVNYAFDSNNS